MTTKTTTEQFTGDTDPRALVLADVQEAITRNDLDKIVRVDPKDTEPGYVLTYIGSEVTAAGHGAEEIAKGVGGGKFPLIKASFLERTGACADCVATFKANFPDGLRLDPSAALDPLVFRYIDGLLANVNPFARRTIDKFGLRHELQRFFEYAAEATAADPTDYDTIVDAFARVESARAEYQVQVTETILQTLFATGPKDEIILA